MSPSLWLYKAICKNMQNLKLALPPLQNKEGEWLENRNESLRVSNTYFACTSHLVFSSTFLFQKLPMRTSKQFFTVPMSKKKKLGLLKWTLHQHALKRCSHRILLQLRMVNENPTLWFCWHLKFVTWISSVSIQFLSQQSGTNGI